MSPCVERRLISVSIPVLNEQDNIKPLYRRLAALAECLDTRYELEFVFSDNHSEDNTWQILSGLAREDARVKAVRFSRNFGFQRSILANYMLTRGDAVMQLDADLQDPPEMLVDFLEQWELGYHVVYGIRRTRPENVLLTGMRRCGYWAIAQLSAHPIPRDAGDFRLIDRKVISALTQIKTANPYLRGMIAGLGFSQKGVPYARNARIAGVSKFNVLKMIGLGLAGVINHSAVPLRIATWLGAVFLIASGLGTLYSLGQLYSDMPRAIPSLHLLVLFGLGLNCFLLGIVGEYMLRIYTVLRAEPVAIVEQSLNMDATDVRL